MSMMRAVFSLAFCLLFCSLVSAQDCRPGAELGDDGECHCILTSDDCAEDQYLDVSECQCKCAERAKYKFRGDKFGGWWKSKNGFTLKIRGDRARIQSDTVDLKINIAAFTKSHYYFDLEDGSKKSGNLKFKGDDLVVWIGPTEPVTFSKFRSEDFVYFSVW
eukprot:TRINITY_DN1747_c0_g1_i1.p1 TRINITY_DN1747_c0_g1~~TRINITY_DN1747_c0_g1_i1.p1  ORF type:complete len:162 (-),score=18.12 TRINITY_DN1747_c0_g1_i1:48-533(-)